MWTLVVHLLILLLAGPTAIARVFNDMQLVQQIMISHYATQGPGQHLLPGLEEATSDDNHLCSSVYSHSQTMTDPRSISISRKPSRTPEVLLPNGSGISDQSLCYEG